MRIKKGQRELLLFHLGEALEELERTIVEIRSARTLNDNGLDVNFMHLYHHINSAWNGRMFTHLDKYPDTELGFYMLRLFPNDIAEQLKNHGWPDHALEAK